MQDAFGGDIGADRGPDFLTGVAAQLEAADLAATFYEAQDGALVGTAIRSLDLADWNASLHSRQVPMLSVPVS